MKRFPELRVIEQKSEVSGRLLITPMIWLGHNLRNRVLFRSDTTLSGAAVLVSYGDAIQRASYKERFFTESLQETLGMNGPIMIDSGGFALLSKPGLSFNVDELRRVYDRARADIVVSLDYPPSPTAGANERAALRKKTLHSYRQLRQIALPERLMPVVHGHSTGEIQRSCDQIERSGAQPRYVGLGGLVPLFRSGGTPARFTFQRPDGGFGNRAEWVGEALSIVRQRFPRAIIHVFGVGSAVTALAVMSLGADSLDSLSWRRAANFGAILLPGRAERFPELNTRRSNSRPVLSADDLRVLQTCNCAVCKASPILSERVAQMASSYEVRAIHNAWTVISEVAEFRRAVRDGAVADFVKSRLRPAHVFYRPVMARLGCL